MKKIYMYFNNDWHFTRSSACHDILINPISKYQPVECKYLSAYDDNEENVSHIFFQDTPSVMTYRDTNSYICLPLWDVIYHWDKYIFNTLYPFVKVLCYSETLYNKFLRCSGHQFLKLKFYLKPNKIVDNFDKIKISYWNRTGLYSKQLLNNIFKNFNAEHITLLNKQDPWYPRHNYSNSDLNIKSTIYTSWTSKEEYLKFTEDSNIFLAPRYNEGIGLSTLEQMAKGSIIVGVNQPTLNEYISDDTGFLLDEKFFHPPNSADHISNPWELPNKITSSELITKQTNMLKSMEEGYNKWISIQDELYNFIIS